MVRSLLRYWALSLMLSAVLAAAAERWPDPLPVEPLWVAALVLTPPLLVLVWIVLHWRLPASELTAEGCRPGEGGQSQNRASMEP